jgi:hypothetical protein
MSYSQADTKTHRAFQIYTSPTVTNAAVANNLIYTHSEGMGTFFIGVIYFYFDSASGTAGTFTNINIGTIGPSYSDIVTSASLSYNGGQNIQLSLTLADTTNPINGITSGQQVYLRWNRTGTNFVTGSVVMAGYHSHNPGDVIGQDQ